MHLVVPAIELVRPRRVVATALDHQNRAHRSPRFSVVARTLPPAGIRG
jgi:hypothetical protein